MEISILKKKNMAQEVLVDTHKILEYAVSRDGSEIYFTDVDRKLYYIKDKASAVKIADSAYSLCLVEDGCLFCLESDHTDTPSRIYFVNNGAAPVVNEEIDNVVTINKAGTNVLLMSAERLYAEGMTYYCRPMNGNFEKLGDRVYS